MAVKTTVCERLYDRSINLGGAMVVGQGGEQLRVNLPQGEVVATWIMKSGRLAYASGFLFTPGQQAKKLTSRELTGMIDEASSRTSRA